MDTFFASSEKTDEKTLKQEVQIINKHPITKGLLDAVSGLLAIADSNRQIVAINYSFLEKLNIDEPEKVLGLRLGDVVKCKHSYELPNGCGTTKYCSSCGAAIAIVTSIMEEKSVERICTINAIKDYKEVDIYLLVKASPIKINEKTYILLFIHDITLQQQRAYLERIFFHDINNMLSALVGSCELLYLKNETSKLVKNIYKSSIRLQKEIEIQKALSQTDTSLYELLLEQESTFKILDELKDMFKNHYAKKYKNLEFNFGSLPIIFKTDSSLLIRILSNMITNALEATEENGIVRVWVENEENEDFFTFCVWNKKEIPEKTALRIFQKNFSTKKGEGRGLGTYSMKLLGEDILGGKVNFTSTKEEGTTFTLKLPIL